MGPTNEQIAAVLRWVLLRLNALPTRASIATTDEITKQLSKLDEPQAAPQRCVECDGVGWIPGRGPDGEPDGERCQACKGAPKPAEVPGCGSPTCRWCGTGATNPTQPPKPRRMAANPTWDFNKYHGAEHDEVEWCKNACCQPVPDAPSAESRTTAWVCVRNGDEAWLVGDGVNCGVSLRPLPSQEELGHIALEAWGNAHRAKTILETKATVGRAIYRALGVSE